MPHHERLSVNELTVWKVSVGNNSGMPTIPPLQFTDTALIASPLPGAMEYSGGHWYITNGARHAIATVAGVKTSTTTVASSAAELPLYSYTFAANELHTDERAIFDISGVYSNDANHVDNDYTIRMKFNGVTIQTITRVGGKATDQGWQVFVEVTVRSEGVAGSYVDFVKFLDGEKVYMKCDVTAHTADTTIANLFEATVQWNSAKATNIFHCTQGSLMFAH